MQNKLTVQAVTTESKGKYKVVNVSYLDENGQKREKSVPNFGESEQPFLSLCSNGAGVYNVTIEKNGKYWNWVRADYVGPAATAQQQQSTQTSQRSGSGWETKEERENRQVLIVRQSSLSNSLKFHEGDDVTLDAVIATAQQMESYVFHGRLPLTQHDVVSSMDDDIPF